MTEIGVRILEARRRRGMSQKDLAEALGVSVQAVSQWENGKTDPTSRIGRLSAALHCDALWLSGEREIDFSGKIGLGGNQDKIPIIRIEDMQHYLSFISDRN